MVRLTLIDSSGPRRRSNPNTEANCVSWRTGAPVSQQNGASLGGHHLEKKFEQRLLQLLHAANGIDGGADLHQRAQVAGHQVKSIVEPDLQRRAADNLAVVKLDLTRLRLPRRRRASERETASRRCERDRHDAGSAFSPARR